MRPVHGHADASLSLRRQARDAAEGRKLLLLDKNALLQVVGAVDETRVMLIPVPRLSVPAACTA